MHVNYSKGPFGFLEFPELKQLYKLQSQKKIVEIPLNKVYNVTFLIFYQGIFFMEKINLARKIIESSFHLPPYEFEIGLDIQTLESHGILKSFFTQLQFIQ